MIGDGTCFPAEVIQLTVLPSTGVVNLLLLLGGVHLLVVVELGASTDRCRGRLAERELRSLQVCLSVCSARSWRADAGEVRAFSCCCCLAVCVIGLDSSATLAGGSGCGKQVRQEAYSYRGSCKDVPRPMVRGQQILNSPGQLSRILIARAKPEQCS